MATRDRWEDVWLILANREGTMWTTPPSMGLGLTKPSGASEPPFPRYDSERSASLTRMRFLNQAQIGFNFLRVYQSKWQDIGFVLIIACKEAVMSFPRR